MYYAREGTRTESFDKFRGGADRITSLRARSWRRGQVQVVYVAPQEPVPYVETPDLNKWEAHVAAGTLRESGASVNRMGTCARGLHVCAGTSYERLQVVATGEHVDETGRRGMAHTWAGVLFLAAYVLSGFV